MIYPEYVEARGKRFKINTDFRIALKCNKIAQDENIGDLERTLAIIYTLFGQDGLNANEDYDELLRLGIKYLRCGEETQEQSTNKKTDMDFEQDQKYIESSFKYDYGYDPYKMDYLHWWEFWNDLNNLSNSEMGDCCILSRVRQIRNYDLSKVKDERERQKIIEAKKQVALKTKKKQPNEKQRESAKRFYEQFYK